MEARVETYGGGLKVRHWQLFIDGEFIADTSTEHGRDRFNKIADHINQKRWDQ